MTNILATCKERIRYFIDIKGVTHKNFFEKTGISRGFLDTDKLNGDVSDKKLNKIYKAFPDIDLHWLITGENNEIKNDIYIKKLIDMLENENHRLKKEIELLKSQKNNLEFTHSYIKK